MAIQSLIVVVNGLFLGFSLGVWFTNHYHIKGLDEFCRKLADLMSQLNPSGHTLRASSNSQ